MSVRYFGRAFVAATGLTPARAVMRLRMEIARPRLEDGREAFDTIAQVTHHEGRPIGILLCYPKMDRAASIITTVPAA